MMHFVLYFFIQIEIGVSFDDWGQTGTPDAGDLGAGFLLSDDAWIWFDDNVLTFVEIESTEFAEGGLDSGFFYFFECSYPLSRGDKILRRFDSHGMGLTFGGRKGIGYC